MTDADAILREALADLHEIDLSSEQHAAYADLFADFGLVRKLNKRDWQIIYGRPGTGKTFYLRMYAEQYDGALPSRGVLPLYIRMQDCLAPPENSDAKTAYQIAHASFLRLLDSVHRQLVLYKRSLRKQQTVMQRLLQKMPGPRDQVDAKLRELHALIQGGVPIEVRSTITIQEEQTDVGDRSTDVGAGIDLGSRGADGRAHVSAGKKSSSVSSRKVSRQSEAVEWPDYRGIRDLLIEIIDGLELERLVVLIDDWSHISISGGPAQAALAEELKRALGGTNKISVKIAANWYQTTLFDSSRGYGLREGHEIHRAVNLDEPLLGLPQFLAFFEELLYKRLALEHPGLASFVEAGTGRPSPAFADAMFGDGAFQSLLLGCEGVPRRVLVAIGFLAERHIDELPWGENRVRDAVVAARARDFATNDATPAERVLDRDVKPVLVSGRAPVFLVSRTDAATLERLTPVLADGLATDRTDEVLSEPLRELFVAFVVRDEVYRDSIRSMQYEDGDEDPPEAPRLPWIETEASASDLLVDGDTVDEGDDLDAT